MIATEMDIPLASSTIAVGETTSLSLAVLPTSAANYISLRHALTVHRDNIGVIRDIGHAVLAGGIGGGGHRGELLGRARQRGGIQLPSRCSRR